MTQIAGLLKSTRNQLSKSRRLIAWSLGRVLTQQQRISGHPSATEVTGLLAMLNSTCDLDVLIFFHRHPRAFLSALELARNVGYDTAEVDASIETLIMAGLVTSSKPKDGGTARLYEFTPGRWASVLSSLLWVASTADGRRTLRRVLMHSPDQRVRSALLDD